MYLFRLDLVEGCRSELGEQLRTEQSIDAALRGGLAAGVAFGMPTARHELGEGRNGHESFGQDGADGLGRLTGERIGEMEIAECRVRVAVSQ